MIELSEVVKTYRGGWAGGSPVRALDGVSLTVAAGTALGVVGLNAAGKSTLMRLLLGYVRPTSGEASVGGVTPRRYAESSGVAYVPERVTIPPPWTVRGALRAYAMLGNLGDDAWDRVEGALDRLGLTPLAERRVGTLSKGNLQRVAIAQALLADRSLMVLDEPTDGLDPVWIAELREIIREWRETDAQRVVVLASHNLAEVERLCDRVVLLHNGRVQAELHPGADEFASLEAEFLRAIGELDEARS